MDGWDEASGKPAQEPRAAEAPGRTGETAVFEEPLPAVPDVLEMDLAELRTVDHPVLREVLADLCDRATGPSDMLWGFNNSF
jgi:FXSXX-COOH protein